MIVILEGIDGSGKSTLASKISKAYNFEIIRLQRPTTKQEFDNQFETLKNTILSNRYKNVVIDRGWLSSVVYGKVLRNKPDFTDQQLEQLEQVFAECGGMYIYCNSNVNDCYLRATTRGEDLVKGKDQFNKLDEEYRKYFEKVKVPVLKYSF